MQRITNRNLSEHQDPIVRYEYIEVPIVETKTEVQYVDREVIKEVPISVEVERIISPEVDLAPIHANIKELQSILIQHSNKVADKLTEHSQNLELAKNELEMQRRAFVAIKAQRDIDRKRRLQFIKRVKKEQTKMKQSHLKAKWALGACLLLSILALVIK